MTIDAFGDCGAQLGAFHSHNPSASIEASFHFITVASPSFTTAAHSQYFLLR